MSAKLQRIFNKNVLRSLGYLALIISCFYMQSVFAADELGSKHLGDIATDITDSFAGIATLMIAIAYIAGLGFVLAAIFKFKQHKDNPTQIPLGTPLAMLVIGVVLIFLPSIFGPAGKTIFGDSAKIGEIKGGGFQQIPGAKPGSGGGK